MWKCMRVKCRRLFFLIIIYINGNAGLDLYNQDFGNGIGTIDENEPGFDYTEAEMAKLKIWPQGVIPYYVDTFSFDKQFRKKLEDFLESVNIATGVYFMKLFNPPKDDFTRWVFFLNRRGVFKSGGCTTKDFTNTGVQKVVLGYDSPFNGELYEATLAILGVPPQHLAPNRDDFITVNFNNILPDKKHLFQVLRNDEWLFHNLDYDFYSAGHYDLYKYSRGGFATIEPKYPVIDGIGDGQGFTYTDKLKIMMMYNYISKSRSKLLKTSDCQKMFKPGPNLKNYTLNAGFSPKPRPKPNKYLGKPDNKVETQTEKIKIYETEEAVVKETSNVEENSAEVKRLDPADSTDEAY